MPKALIFAPCAQVLINEQDRLVSLITVFEGLNVSPPPEAAPDPHASVNLQWSALALWRMTPEEIGTTYEQRVQLILPAGEVVAEGVATFTALARSHRAITRFPGVIVGTPGEQTIRLSIREQTPEAAWQVAGEYPLDITHISQPDPTSNTAQEAPQTTVRPSKRTSRKNSPA